MAKCPVHPSVTRMPCECLEGFVQLVSNDSSDLLTMRARHQSRAVADYLSGRSTLPGKSCRLQLLTIRASFEMNRLAATANCLAIARFLLRPPCLMSAYLLMHASPAWRSWHWALMVKCRKNSRRLPPTRDALMLSVEFAN